MSPMMLRFFTLVGIALAAASMQLKAKAAAPDALHAQASQAFVVPALPLSVSR